MIIEPLAGYDAAGNLIPKLAVEIPTLENGGISADLTSITWKLLPGLLWSDGTPVTADDVVFTGNYCMDPAGGCAQASKFDGVASIEAVDAATVKVTFSAPKPNPYTAFVGALSPIIQKAQFAACTGAAAPTVKVTADAGSPCWPRRRTFCRTKKARRPGRLLKGWRMR